jgi:hypothetical protein
MAVESKPLFHREVMRQQVRAFRLPEHVAASQAKLQHWAGLIASGRADEFKESDLLPEFLTDIFCGLLGYTGPAQAGEVYTLSRERHVEVDGKFADAVLGRFGKEQEQFIAVLEGKGTRDPLDRPFAGRRMVEQALGVVLKVRFETLRCQHEAEAAGTARKALADPNAYDLTALNDPQRGRFFLAANRVLVQRTPTDEANRCELRHETPQMLQKAL